MPCKWQHNERHSDWDTECGETFEGDMSPYDKAINYCPNCGGRIENITDSGNKDEQLAE